MVISTAINQSIEQNGKLKDRAQLDESILASFSTYGNEQSALTSLTSLAYLKTHIDLSETI